MPRTLSLIRTAFCWLLRACRQMHKRHSAKQNQYDACDKVADTVKSRPFSAHLRVVSHDVIKACQQAEAGADLYVHGSIHIVEEV